MRSHRMMLLVVAITPLMVSRSLADGEKRAERPQTNYAFEEKILYIVTKLKDSTSEYGRGVYEKVRVIRLGDRSFHVGQVPDFGVKVPDFGVKDLSSK
jgi:hypothetical protein